MVLHTSPDFSWIQGFLKVVLAGHEKSGLKKTAPPRGLSSISFASDRFCNLVSSAE
jgi:hypothetical protein